MHAPRKVIGGARRETCADEIGAVDLRSGHVRCADARRASGPEPAAALASSSLVELFARDLLVGHLGELDQEVDHLLLVDRRAQARRAPADCCGSGPGPPAPGRGTGARDRRSRACISSSVTLILFLSPISASTRPRRTRRSAILRYSGLAFSSVVPSSSKVRPCSLRSLSTVLPDVAELLLHQRRRQARTGAARRARRAAGA